MSGLESGGSITVSGVTMTVCEGVVRNVTSRTETRVVSAGQERSVSKVYRGFFSDYVQTTHVNAPTVANETVRDFWVVSGDGVEKHVETTAPVDVRDGHAVWLLLYDDTPAFIANIDIGQWWALPEVEGAFVRAAQRSDAPVALSYLRFGTISWWWIVGALFTPLFLGGLWALAGFGWFVLGLLFWGLCVYAGPVRFFQRRQAARTFEAFLQLVSTKLTERLRA